MRSEDGEDSPGGNRQSVIGTAIEELLHQVLACASALDPGTPDRAETFAGRIGDGHDRSSRCYDKWACGGMDAAAKGAAGEARVEAMAGTLLPAQDYRQLHDVTLPIKNGETQIDHVLVSRFGVFVVETKNLNGWIFGRPGDRTWTQRFQNGARYAFPNPLRQNAWHVRALSDMLVPRGIPMRAIHSVVAFVGGAEIKTVMPRNVTVGCDFVRYIRSFSASALMPWQVETVMRTIASARR